MALVVGAPVASAAWTVTFDRYDVYEVSGAAGGFDLGDVTGDGRTDVVHAIGGETTVFAQQDDGTLKRGATSDAYMTRVSDLNGDGRLDLIGVTPQGHLRIAVGHGDGTFGDTQDLGYAPLVDDLRVADLDGDTDDDIAILTNAGIEVLTQQAGGKLAVARVASGRWEFIRVADLNGDGRADFVAPGWMAGIDYVVHQSDGSYRVQNVTAPTATAMSVGPLFNATDTMVFPTIQESDGRYGGLYRITGGENVARYVSARGAVEGTAMGDLDGNGRPDTLVGMPNYSPSGYNRSSLGFWLNSNWNDEFILEVPYASHYHDDGLRIGDVDCNGRPDILISSGSSQSFDVIRQAGPPVTPCPPLPRRTFAPVPPPATTGEPLTITGSAGAPAPALADPTPPAADPRPPSAPPSSPAPPPEPTPAPATSVVVQASSVGGEAARPAGSGESVRLGRASYRHRAVRLLVLSATRRRLSFVVNVSIGSRTVATSFRVPVTRGRNHVELQLPAAVVRAVARAHRAHRRIRMSVAAASSSTGVARQPVHFPG
ncbi:MAG: FG-GAP repeat domain-containing protein [Solirubrobacteraceae bacterium]